MAYWNGVGGKLIGVTEGTMSDEKDTHWLFMEQMTGEWGTIYKNEHFRIDDEILAYVEDTANVVNVKTINNITIDEIRNIAKITD